MIALVDCNNFYASCETLFRPDLVGKPVIVLSNNDGCVISRSPEAKQLGIQMGVPFFKCRDVCIANSVNVFSSNFALYGDISNRIMSILRQFAPTLEVYSVDEAFLDLSEVPAYKINSYLRTIRQTILRYVGVSVSIGFGSTKTLAKVANYHVKKNQIYHGILNLYEKSESERERFLLELPVEEIWGVGRRYAKRLNSFSINTAADLLKQSPAWIKSYMTIVGLRTYMELKGERCLELDTNPSPKKNIVCSKSFGGLVFDINDLEVALSNFTERLSQKLRQQNSKCLLLGVFIQSNRFSCSEKFYSNSLCLPVESGGNSVAELLRVAKAVLKSIYKPGIGYKKIGVFASQITDDSSLQLNMFNNNLLDIKKKNSIVMDSMDFLNNKFGRKTISLAACLGGKQWQMKSDLKSPRYTTCLNELKLIKI